jgi:hypothetical protein
MSQDETHYIDLLSALSVRSFASTEEALDALLALLADQLGVRTSFASELSRDDGLFTVLAAHEEVGGIELAPGTVRPLPLTF